MRFFDEDNNQFEWTMGFLLTIIILYFGSYVIVRTRNTWPCEADGCYYENIYIPRRGIWRIYTPIMTIDRKYFRAEFVD